MRVSLNPKPIDSNLGLQPHLGQPKIWKVFTVSSALGFLVFIVFLGCIGFIRLTGFRVVVLGR